MEPEIYEKSEKKPHSKFNILLYFYMILILLVLLTVASYAWFSLSRTPRVSNLSLNIAARTGLELAYSPDSEEWGNQLSYSEMIPETSPLRPVTWSEKDQTFYAAVYGADGRLTDRWMPLPEDRYANKDNYDGYYCLGTFYARTSEKVKVSLSPAKEMLAGVTGAGTYLIGTPTWNSEDQLHENGGQGAENAIRIGIRITYLDENNTPTNEPTLFYIYEPNSDTHVHETEGYIPTPSIDGTASLVSSDRLLIQTHSTWVESDPIQHGVQLYTFGEFTTPTELFQLDAGEKAMIQLYIWLEGQDVDCVNSIRESHITANIQFDATTEDHSGMTPFED